MGNEFNAGYRYGVEKTRFEGYDKLVHCKDCKFHSFLHCFLHHEYVWPNKPGSKPELMYKRVKDDDFCSWGERRV